MPVDPTAGNHRAVETVEDARDENFILFLSSAVTLSSVDTEFLLEREK